MLLQYSPVIQSVTIGPVQYVNCLEQDTGGDISPWKVWEALWSRWDITLNMDAMVPAVGGTEIKRYSFYAVRSRTERRIAESNTPIEKERTWYAFLPESTQHNSRPIACRSDVDFIPGDISSISHSMVEITGNHLEQRHIPVVVATELIAGIRSFLSPMESSITDWKAPNTWSPSNDTRAVLATEIQWALEESVRLSELAGVFQEAANGSAAGMTPLQAIKDSRAPTVIPKDLRWNSQRCDVFAHRFISMEKKLRTRLTQASTEWLDTKHGSTLGRTSLRDAAATYCRDLLSDEQQPVSDGRSLLQLTFEQRRDMYCTKDTQGPPQRIGGKGVRIRVTHRHREGNQSTFFLVLFAVPGNTPESAWTWHLKLADPDGSPCDRGDIPVNSNLNNPVVRAAVNYILTRTLREWGVTWEGVLNVDRIPLAPKPGKVIREAFQWLPTARGPSKGRGALIQEPKIAELNTMAALEFPDAFHLLLRSHTLKQFFRAVREDRLVNDTGPRLDLAWSEAESTTAYTVEADLEYLGGQGPMGCSQLPWIYAQSCGVGANRYVAAHTIEREDFAEFCMSAYDQLGKNNTIYGVAGSWRNLLHPVMRTIERRCLSTSETRASPPVQKPIELSGFTLSLLWSDLEPLLNPQDDNWKTTLDTWVETLNTTSAKTAARQAVGSYHTCLSLNSNHTVCVQQAKQVFWSFKK